MEAESFGKYNAAASVYFDELRFFFGNEWRKDGFKECVEYWVYKNNKPDILDLRTLTIHEFYTKALETCGKDVERRICFLENISLCDADAVIKDFYKWKKETHGSSKNDWVPKFRQMVSVDFQIQGTELFHSHDLQCFSERIDHVFQWHTDMQMKRQFVAPYFCFVQSSGMGKTKIMHEYEKEALKANITSLLILPSDAKFDQDGYIYRGLDLGISVSPNDTFHSESAKCRFVAERIFRRLDRFLYELQTPEKRNELQKVALLFDESQLLLKAEFGLEAFRFRCVRLWLHEKRHDAQVVAVFAGTYLRFATLFDFGWT